MVALMASAASFAGMANEREQPMHSIRIILGEHIISATLEDNPSTRDFLAQLPLSFDLDDYSSTEKIAYLPHKLATTGAPAGVDPKVGDVTYYAPWGNLAIFYRDFGYSRGLIRLGRITDGLEYLGYSGSRQVRVELVSMD
ncbi:cyclophilin-like fold protein [Pseudomonas aeruginosa]|uniref:cyclophilin-like fold protein n=1 Tax=Pseudomonas aeruginosa TaxID=287 RepID=UPI001EEEFB75|nr:cyclophilin-like fold protein [Pseudomonas aeruginosa]